MILSHSKRFILIRPPKVASSSILMSFLPHLGEDDYVWGLSEEEVAQAGGTSALVDGSVSRWPWKLHAHSHIVRVVQIFGPAVLDYRIITLARNPWDQMVSGFFWITRDENVKELPFEDQKSRFKEFVRDKTYLPPRRRVADWIDGRKRRSQMPQSELCEYRGEFMADNLIFFEDLPGGLSEVSSVLNIELTLPPRKAKSGYRPQYTKDWTSFYDATSKALVEAGAASDIARYGYTFQNDVQPSWQKTARV